ncbi:cytochrome c oxidase subunit 4 [Modicisalibacter ilicicola DSM 19980]|uniref:Cytochrome c oxidase subunit 4 n=1 Tax=Modicisalibacter ilicicola DSM 19980 TaxID=1121942 RepID=A0A1M5CJV6_9GAMM|nr:hypothetical protein [Halomonas ilicicola]SHF54702.1 cytochrome c oxidase subunit 4 [Halomonas ilicicola DSM 19980]
MRVVTTLFVTWLCLLVLLGISVTSVVMLSLPWSLVAVAACALSMILLILVLFMDLKHSRGLTRVYATGATLWLAFLITLTLADYLTR